jgi:iron(III) transport system ATP-binding protein
LGRLPASGIHTGPVEVMLRPEDLLLTPNQTGSAEVIEREYFGHDQLLKLRLESGTVLRSRLLGSDGDFHPGQRVGLKVRDKVVTYPASD